MGASIGQNRIVFQWGFSSIEKSIVFDKAQSKIFKVEVKTMYFKLRPIFLVTEVAMNQLVNRIPR